MRKAKQTIKNTEKATKETAKAIVNVVKATFTATKSLIAMIIAGGWVAVFILLIIVLFGAWFAIAGGDESEQTELFSAEVIAYEPLIQQYADQYGISEYVELIKAVMMQESNGQGADPMGSSESEYNVRYPRAPNEILEPEYSIYCGVLELNDCLTGAGVTNPIDTLLYIAGLFVVQTLLALALALALQKNTRKNQFFRAYFFLPMVFSATMISMTWNYMYDPNLGVINTILGMFGVEGYPGVNLMDAGWKAIILIVFVHIWANIGYPLIIITSGLNTISGELGEAAMVDGANAWQTFKEITFPLLIDYFR